MAHVWKGGNMYIWTIFIIYVPAPDAAALLIIQPASYFQVCCWSEKDANLVFGEFLRKTQNTYFSSFSLSSMGD